ncbi:MAG TPA: hypothetical protein PK357_01400 [Candidatus Pacearchaeota archaeon]|nr:hypothetical protein [Candidatus Pacearchaeota archaeon]
MKSHKHALLIYGLEKGYYTKEEFDWCVYGENIKNYKEMPNSNNVPQKKNLASKL